MTQSIRTPLAPHKHLTTSWFLPVNWENLPRGTYYEVFTPQESVADTALPSQVSTEPLVASLHP